MPQPRAAADGWGSVFRGRNQLFDEGGVWGDGREIWRKEEEGGGDGWVGWKGDYGVRGGTEGVGGVEGKREGFDWGRLGSGSGGFQNFLCVLLIFLKIVGIVIF